MLAAQAFDIQSLHRAYAAGTPVREVVAEAYRRIAAADPGIFLSLAPQEAVLAAAEALGPFDPQAKPLWGLPFAVKDNIDVAGLPTTAACPAFTYAAESDAFVVDLLRRAGALMIGKTNLDQFATGLVGLRTPYPAPRNALDPELVPGGSSSGSAVSVALGLVSFALGTDTAGSGRVPAALNGIVGLKPSLGALSCSGVVPACRTLDTVSVFALTVEDAWRVFRATAVADSADPYSRPMPAPALSAPQPILRVGVPDRASRIFFGDRLQEAAFDAALEALEAFGAEVRGLDFSLFYEVAALLYEGAWVAERHAVVEALLRDRPEAVLPVTRQVIGRATELSSTDVFRSFYRLAELKRRIRPLLEGLDLLCVPSMPEALTRAAYERDPVGANSRLGLYTNFVNLLDLCGITVPLGRRGDGLPGSITLLARAGEDQRSAALAAALQRASVLPLGATGWLLPAGEAAAEAPGPGEVALGLVGAHMSGLPLNGQVTGLGGRFLRQARTAATYRLYLLPGMPPQRPGLVYDPAGSAVALEVWALPEERLGALIARIPRPLGIGTLLLEEGAEIKGFLCEAGALAGAQEITRYGGWRAFLEAQATSGPLTPGPLFKETDYA